MTHVHGGRTIARNTIAMTTALVGQKALAFLYFAIIARELSVEETGRYFLATSFALLFSVIADLGFAPLLIREASKLRDGVQTKLAGILGAKLFLSLIALSAMNVVAWAIPAYPLMLKLMITIASVSVIIESWNLTWYGILRGWQRLKYESAGILLAQGTAVGLGLFFLFFTRNLYLLVAALLIGNLVGFVWGVVMVRRHTRVSLVPSMRPRDVRVMFVAVVPFALAALFTRITGWSDGFLLSLLGTEEMVGLYSVPFKVVFALQFVPLAFAAALLPAMSAQAAHERPLLAETYLKSTLYLFYVGLPAALGIALLADAIIPTVFGVSYLPAVATMQVLAFTLVFLFVQFPMGSLLVAIDRQRTHTALVGVGMIVSVSLNVSLIPMLGMLAPAIASVAASACVFFFGLAVARAHVALPFAALSIGALKGLAAGAVMAAVLLFMKPLFPLALMIAVGAVTYSVFLYFIRGITREELCVLVSMRSRK